MYTLKKKKTQLNLISRNNNTKNIDTLTVLHCYHNSTLSL